MKPTKYYSNTQEKYVAKKLGGRKQLNSGATPFYKGDVILKDVLIECKTPTTEKKSFSIKKEWITKLNNERIGMRKKSCAIVFGFEPNGEQFCVIPIDDYKQLLKDSEELFRVGEVLDEY